uniref:Rab11 family-interacting protein 3-like n=1 Tax=Phallusia mammillata TaxID=59560 RepID=A0A6F9DR26_9ASCI|nr:rab11 family-interacting protein 3-like [Phallusia mammillata]
MATIGGDLQEVFDLCSPDGDGFIVTEYLANKLEHQFNDQTVDKIQEVLDPQRQGRISFEQFCGAVVELQNGPVIEIENLPNKNLPEDDASISDPENTYNEYDLVDEEVEANEMESFEAFGESPQKLSPVKTHEAAPPEYFVRRSSMRKSHRRSHSWNNRPGLALNQPSEPQLDDTSSVSSEYEDLSEKVEILQDHVSRLAEDKNLQAQYETVKRENQRLTSRVHELEEKVQDLIEQETRTQKNTKHQLEELRLKLSREKDLEIQVCQSRVDLLAQEKHRLEADLAQNASTLQEAKASSSRAQTKLEELTEQLVETNEEYRRLSQRFSNYQEKQEHEQEKLREEISQFQSMVASVQREKTDLEEEIAFMKIDPNSERLKAHVDDLKVENDQLKHTNEELNVQLAQNISDVRSLMCDDQSLAQEMSDATKDEVIEALKKQEQINEQLRDYLDRIILSVLERDPGILEIK